MAALDRPAGNDAADALFTRVTLGSLALRNRIVMAPMTRSRCTADGVPTDLVAEYYAQRAGAGLIVTEGIAPCADGLGYCRTPGLFSAEQLAGWSAVVSAVHERGGLIVAQLMHVGRVASHFNKPEGSETVAPSALRARGEIYTDRAGMASFDEPRALRTDEIPQVEEQYRRAAANARAAGFDGVELHCSSGYLPAQFLSTGTNRRTDAYGGSVENRCRFPLELLAALAAEVGPGRVGMRICPDNPFNDLTDDNPAETFDCLLRRAAPLGLAYLHVIRLPAGRVDNLALGRRYFGDRLLVNDSYDRVEAAAVIRSGEAAAVSFGRAFIANPDLPERLRRDATLAKFNPGTLYTPGATGYTDYPALV